MIGLFSVQNHYPLNSSHVYAANTRKPAIEKQISHKKVQRSYKNQPSGKNCKYWDSIITKYAKNRREIKWAKAVMRCESGCNVYSRNKRSGASGLFQWIPKYWNKQYPESIWDGKAQVYHSLQKFRQGGKNLWSCTKILHL